MIVQDVDLAILSTDDLHTARGAARAMRAWARRESEPDVAKVYASVQDSLEAELVGRGSGRGRGTARLAVYDFADEDPDAAEVARQRVIGYLQVARDDTDLPDTVRELFNEVMCALSDPSPIARAVELARLDALANGTGAGA